LLGNYYWELFFYTPMLIANYLNVQQKFEQAEQWYRYVFDPTTEDRSNGRVWRFVPLQNSQPLPLIGEIHYGVTAISNESQRETLRNRTAEVTYEVNSIDYPNVDAANVAAFLRDNGRVLSGSESDLARPQEQLTHRIAGTVFLAEGNYVFSIDHDDGAALLINGVQIFLNSSFAAQTAEVSYQATYTGLHSIEAFVAPIQNEVELVIQYRVDREGTSFRPLNAQSVAEQYLLQNLYGVIEPEQLNRFINDPFDPHAVARLRLSAYQSSVFSRYLSNLIDRGDKLFRRATREALVDATLVYTQAQQLVGALPQSVGELSLSADAKVSDILGQGPLDFDGDGDIDLIDADLQQMSNPLSPSIDGTLAILAEQALNMPMKPIAVPENLILNRYFAIPENDLVFGLSDRVNERLFNIRNGLDINGRRLSLALFQPPLDPAQVAGLVANGTAPSQLRSGPQALVPHYRFDVLIERAKEITGIVSNFGQSLLSVLERNDGTELEELQAGYERELTNLNRQVLNERIEADNAGIRALRESRNNAMVRQTSYQTRIDGGFNTAEIVGLTLNAGAIVSTGVSLIPQGIAIAGHLVPTNFGLSVGVLKPGDAIQATGNIANTVSSMLSQGANISNTVASYQRREEDWILQRDIAEADIAEINERLNERMAQLNATRNELVTSVRQEAQQRDVELFLRQNRTTSNTLYAWLKGRLSSLYFQAYQLAYAAAQEAQLAWQFERGHSQNFISTGYWDDLRQGLLAGDALMLSLERMQQSYIQQHSRRFEISKTVSLRNPVISGEIDFIQALKDADSNQREIQFTLPTMLFDLDYPGHYLRQIKNIRITFPAVVGPYENFNATLTQTNNRVLLVPDSDSAVSMLGGDFSAPGIRSDFRNNQGIAVSQGVNDSGLFQLDFGDPRYLPFEGTGAVSEWKLKLSPGISQAAVDSLTDIIIEISYSSEDGGSSLRQAVESELNAN